MQSIMVGTLSLYELFAYFFIYSFLGWIVEVGFHAVTQGKFVNRGFLNGPVCPIYGTGVVLILLVLGEDVDNIWIVFGVGVLLPTAIELITGWAMETFFHNKWWDYSDRKMNFKGYICLEFSTLWGLAVVFVIKGVHPGIEWFAGLFNETWGTVLSCIFTAALLADLIVTVMQVLKLNKKLKELDRVAKAMCIGSDFIGGKVTDVVLGVYDRAAGTKDLIVEKAEAAREEWAKRRDEITAKMPKRLLKAFPSLRSKDSPDSVALARESVEEQKQQKKQKQQKG